MVPLLSLIMACLFPLLYCLLGYSSVNRVFHGSMAPPKLRPALWNHMHFSCRVVWSASSPSFWQTNHCGTVCCDGSSPCSSVAVACAQPSCVSHKDLRCMLMTSGYMPVFVSAGRYFRSHLDKA